MVVGPAAAGKTQLLTSLRRCIEARSHSYTNRYTASFGGINDDFRDIEKKLQDSKRRGLKLEATQAHKCTFPEFTLRLTRESWPNRIYDTRFRTFEAGGGLLEKRTVERDKERQECRDKLEQGLQNCDSVLICLPIIGWINSLQEQELYNFLDIFLGYREIHTLMVCMTMYEKLATGYGRNAYRILATRSAAKSAMRNAFDGQLHVLDTALRQFSKRRKNQIWCTPVSSYGFVPYNGGANLSLIRYMVNNRTVEADYLRTIPTPAEEALRKHIHARPYSERQAYHTYWRPFLTIDPFVFIATGDSKGTLIHHYKELRW